MTHFRSVIKFGDSSFVISLPKTWLEKNAIKKGDVVGVEEGGNNELVVRTKDQPQRSLREITLDLDAVPIEGFKALFISAYLNNYDVINIVGKKVVDVSNEVRTFIHNLASVEITEQTSKRMVAKTFLDPKTVAVDSLIRRIDTMVRSMLEDGKDCLMGKDLYEYVYQKEQDVTRLTFLAYKILKRACNEPEVASSLHLDNEMMLKYWSVITQLEKIADQAKRIQKHVRGKKLRHKEQLIETLEKLTVNYKEIMKAFYNGDKNLALEMILQKTSVLDKCKALVKENMSISDFGVIEKFRNIGAFSFHIAELVLDHE